jgi:hypothetical protein
VAALHALGARGHLEDLIDAGGAQILERHAPHHEGGGLAPLGAAEQRLVVVAEQAQEIGAAALAPAQVGGVIDETGEIRVLEIDADGENVAPPALVLDQAPREIGPGCRWIKRRHRP